MDEKLNHLDNRVLGVAVLTDRCSDTGSYSRSASAELISSHYKLTLFIVCVSGAVCVKQTIPEACGSVFR